MNHPATGDPLFTKVDANNPCRSETSWCAKHGEFPKVPGVPQVRWMVFGVELGYLTRKFRNSYTDITLKYILAEHNIPFAMWVPQDRTNMGIQSLKMEMLQETNGTEGQFMIGSCCFASPTIIRLMVNMQLNGLANKLRKAAALCGNYACRFNFESTSNQVEIRPQMTMRSLTSLKNNMDLQE